ncbi:hypothetical protein FA047_12140 [Pedobacter frigoris]|uniref:Arm DNA-binding domain-containing protein n=1 Tax=Pedobacter frigoris TaxID=2571272 RepID=A0A4U1CJ28_9SPHI|nr:hypothetical protein FA047_12140 [Pedobacter frigoris]
MKDEINKHFRDSFCVRMNRGKNGKAAIYVRIVVNKSRCEVALKRMLDLSDWKQSKGLAKPRNETLKSLNSYLEQCRCLLASHYQDFIINKQLVTAKAMPFKATEPALAPSKPAHKPSNVVLPLPEGPVMATVSPLVMAKLISSNTVRVLLALR